MAKKATKKATAKKATTKKAAAKTTKKATVKKAAAKTTKKAAAKTEKKAKRPVPEAFKRALTPSATLAEIVGSKPLPRSQANKKIWDHIKKNNLQDPKNRTMINADDKLKAIFSGKKSVHMMQIGKYLSMHLTK